MANKTWLIAALVMVSILSLWPAHPDLSNIAVLDLDHAQTSPVLDLNRNLGSQQPTGSPLPVFLEKVTMSTADSVVGSGFSMCGPWQKCYAHDVKFQSRPLELEKLILDPSLWTEYEYTRIRPWIRNRMLFGEGYRSFRFQVTGLEESRGGVFAAMRWNDFKGHSMLPPLVGLVLRFDVDAHQNIKTTPIARILYPPDCEGLSCEHHVLELAKTVDEDLVLFDVSGTWCLEEGKSWRQFAPEWRVVSGGIRFHLAAPNTPW